MVLTKKIKNIDIFDFCILLIAFLPAALISGPLLPEIIINFLNIVFLIYYFKSEPKNYKNKLFIFFLVFYFYLLVNTFFFTNVYKAVWLNVIFYFRFFIFAFAVSYFLKKKEKNLSFIAKIFFLTIFILIFDGYFQFIFEKNIFGFEKYREDRISGLFDDSLIMGSFLFRILPVFLFLIFYLKNNLFSKILYLLLFSLTIFLIYLTGERAAFFLTLIFLFLILIQLSFKLKTKIIALFFFILVLISSMILNPTIFDRYVNQTKIQLFDGGKNFMPYYRPMFETSLKMFKQNKMFGLGPKAYRYYCSDPKYVSYFDAITKIDNHSLNFELSWKYSHKNLVITKFFVEEGDIIHKGDLIGMYNFVDDKDNYKLISNKDGKIKSIIFKDKYTHIDKVLTLQPLDKNLGRWSYYKKNSCNTHPHNFYFQILAETGLIGFFFIAGLFIFISIKLIKNIYKQNFKNNLFKTLDIYFISFYFCVLFPFTTNGNFFNNWINIISFYPLGFYLFYLTKHKYEK